MHVSVEGRDEPGDSGGARAAGELELLALLMSQWAGAWEAHVLRHGAPLDAAQLIDARGVGVASPQDVRLLSVPNVPLPHHPLLFDRFVRTGVLSPCADGLTVGRGVLVKEGCFPARYWVTHELAHVAQYERHGGLGPTLGMYVEQLLAGGYETSALEQEAHRAALAWLGRDETFRREAPWLFA